jgi:hypothetical protein
MTLQEAYNKGLDDAENKIISEFQKIILHDEDNYQAFLNPKMEAIRSAFEKWGTYLYAHSDSKTMKGKRVEILLKTTKELITQ